MVMFNALGLSDCRTGDFCSARGPMLEAAGEDETAVFAGGEEAVVFTAGREEAAMVEAGGEEAAVFEAGGEEAAVSVAKGIGDKRTTKGAVCIGGDKTTSL